MQSIEKKNVFWNILGTSVNAFVSFFLLIFVTRINGEDVAGIFSFAFSVSLIFNVIGVYYGRVYQVSDNSKNSDYDYLVSKIIVCIIMMIVSILFVILNRYFIYKIIVILLLCLLKCIEAFSETLYAIIQKNEQLYKVGFSFFIKGMLCIIIFLIIDIITKNLLLSIISLIIIHLFFIIFYDIKNVKNVNINKNIDFNNVKFLLKDGFYPFAITFLSLYIFNSSKYAIDLNLDNVSQTIFGIIIMPATVILMFVQYMLHPYLNEITKLYNEHNNLDLMKIINKFFILITILTVLGLLISATIAIPIFNIIYGLNLAVYKLHLFIIMIGAGFYGVVSLLMNIFIVMRKNKFQTLLLFIFSIIAFILSYVLTEKYTLLGSSISYSILMILLCIIYMVSLKKILKEDFNEKD